MHRKFSLVAVLALVSVAAAFAASTAGAATPADRKIAALTKQVAALSKQVTVLKKQVATVTKAQKSDEGGIAAAIVLGLCNTAITSDALAGTWNVVDQIPGGPVKFGPQTTLDDKQACQALNVTRSQTVPPTLAPFAAILALGSPNPLAPAFKAAPAWLSR